jgi:hypothetical protein
MKLISDFKDYYDGCLALDVDDQELLFKRKSDNIVTLNETFSELFGTRRRQVEIEDILYNISENIIGVCGKIYKEVQLTQCEYTLGWSKTPLKSISLYPTVIEKDLETLYNVYENSYNNLYFSSNKKKYISEYLDDNLERYQYIFNEYKVPVFCIKPNKNTCDLLLAPKLQDLGFPRVLDSFQAFQEIRMFMENMKKEEPDVNIPTGDDIVLAHSKGFDGFSFRTPKGKSKRINKKPNCN